MVHLDLHYVDPRLVELYDSANPRGADTEFYIRLAADLNAHTILDLGCGTGILTRELAINERKLIGVDPSPAMLAVARRGPDADRVQWVEGDSSVLGRPEADLVIMTGNVAQVFLDDADWASTRSTRPCDLAVILPSRAVIPMLALGNSGIAKIRT